MFFFGGGGVGERFCVCEFDVASGACKSDTSLSWGKTDDFATFFPSLRRCSRGRLSSSRQSRVIYLHFAARISDYHNLLLPLELERVFYDDY